MYIPAAFREDDIETLVAFMRANSFISLVSVQAGSIVASHIPVVVTLDDRTVTLTGHVAKANPQWQAFADGESLAIFAGPHAYISPTLYEKRESVPTWNYQAVHAYGTPRIVTADSARATVRSSLTDLINAYEPTYNEQWAALPDKYRDGMMQGIVAFEMIVTRLDGKYKLSQNRSEKDQRTVSSALLTSPDPVITGVGEAMQAILAQRESQ